MIKSAFRILSLTIIVIILLIGGIFGFYFVKNYISDQSTLRQIPEKVSWVENFYTTNARYPNQAEFKTQFPDFYKISKRGYGGVDGDTPQDFILSYDLSKERADAIGTPAKGVLGYEGYYDVRPCPRWSILGLTTQEVPPFAGNGMYVSPPSGMIFSDFNTGTVYFSHIENYKSLNDKVPLLNGLNKPRLFQKTSQDKTIKIIVTNGNDVFSYDWVGAELKL